MKKAEERISEILEILKGEYPSSRTALDFGTPLQLLIATILSAQCTDVKVNQITPQLFRKYKSVDDFANADQGELEREIRPTGFFRNKAKSIIGSAKKIVEDFGGKVPDTMEGIITLPGVARKTANIVLSSAFKKAEGIAVDTHVKRLAQRLGLTKEKDPNKIEGDLLAVVPQGEWIDFNYRMVSHGRKVCQARRPQCPVCALHQLCPSAREFFPQLDDTLKGGSL